MDCGEEWLTNQPANEPAWEISKHDGEQCLLSMALLKRPSLVARFCLHTGFSDIVLRELQTRSGPASLPTTL